MFFSKRFFNVLSNASRCSDDNFFVLLMILPIFSILSFICPDITNSAHPSSNKFLFFLLGILRPGLHQVQNLFSCVLYAGFQCHQWLKSILLYGYLPRDRCARLLRSEEHTSELQSQSNLVCRLLLEKK